MGCRPSMLDCLRAKVPLRRKGQDSSDASDSLTITDLTESTKDEDSGRFTLDIVEEQDKLKRRKVPDSGRRKRQAHLERAGSGDENIAPEDELDHPTIKGPRDFENNLLTVSVSTEVKALIVCGKNDQQTDLLANTSRKLGWIVSIANNEDQALEMFENRVHEVIIIDRRTRISEADKICRSLKNSSNCTHAVILALVKKSFYLNTDKDEVVLFKLLESGYDKALTENTHEGVLINDLVGVYNSCLLPRLQLAAAHTLYLALDRCRSMVHVTDNKNIIQFVSKSTTKLLGYKPTELMGTNIMDIIWYENSGLIEQQLNRGREFEGTMNCRKKTLDNIPLNCRIIPYSMNLKQPTHYIYVYDPPNDGSCATSCSNYLGQKMLPRRSSGTNVCEGRRRSSLQNLQLEAPITKVITLLANAVTDATSSETATSVLKAIEILKTTELYSPQLKEDKGICDPVATDLVGALLASSRTAWDSRRSSTDSVRVTPSKIYTSASGTRLHVKGLKTSNEIVQLLEKSFDWDFEIFQLEHLTEKRTLLFLGANIMETFQVAAKLGVDDKIVYNWLNLIEANYRSENSYHNSTHAVDVMQATARFMQSERLKQILGPLDEVAALVAAAAHDIDHPGRSSQFLCNTDNKLAILYNDLTVLESHHAALTFKLTLSDAKVDIFQNLTRDTYKALRHTVIDMILATEMTKHFEHLAKFMNICSAKITQTSPEPFADDIDMSILLQPENVTLIKRMMIKCADVSNPTRPLKMCMEWSRRIAEEYFNQTEEEKRLNVPVVMPMFDRLTCSIPKSQIGFVDYIINDMIEAWDAFIDMPEMVGYMKQNYKKWNELKEKGVETIQDMMKLQELMEYKIC